MITGSPFRGIAALATLFLSAAAAAQVLTVSPSPILNVGDTATISYANVAYANQEIEVEISGGDPVVIRRVKIKLDGAGKGSGTWIVEAWEDAFFDAPGSPSVVMPIQ